MNTNLLVVFIVALLLQKAACQPRNHEQCRGYGSLYFRRHCIAGVPFRNALTCRNDVQCRRGVVPPWRRRSVACKNGQCFSLLSIGPQQCSDQRNCPGQSICIRRVCVPAVPTDRECRRNGRCAVGERCIGDLCFRPLDSLPRGINVGGMNNNRLPEYDAPFWNHYGYDHAYNYGRDYNYDYRVY